MPLAARQAELVTAITDLETLVNNCLVDINASDPDAETIRRIRERGQSALESVGGFDAGVYGGS